MATPQDLLDLLLQSYTQATIPIHTLSPDDLALLTRMRETFLAAGAAQVLADHDPTRWMQLGVQFQSREQHAAFLDADLARQVQGWLDRGLITAFFDMNKPPGVRLRFCGPRLQQTLAPELHAFLEARQAQGRLVRWEHGLYDPETWQFGGVAGLDLMHRFATADSLCACRLLDLERRDALTLDRASLSLLLLDHLLTQVVGDDWERWDVWGNMRLTGRVLDPSPAQHAALEADLAENREALLALLRRPDEVRAELSPEEQAIVADHHQAMTRVGQDLRRAAQQGQLTHGPRQILPFYIIFHWNRWMFDQPTQVALTWFMRALLDPKQG